MNSYTEAELKFFQSQIRSMNWLKGKLEKAGKIGDEAGSLVEDLIEYDYMTVNGFARYSMKMLKEMTENEIEVYIENIDKANDFLNLIKSSEDINKVLEGTGTLTDPETTFWKLFDMLKDRGVELDSDVVRDMVDEALDGKYTSFQMKEHIKNFYKAMTEENYGLASFKERFNEIRNLKSEVE